MNHHPEHDAAEPTLVDVFIDAALVIAAKDLELGDRVTWRAMSMDDDGQMVIVQVPTVEREEDVEAAVMRCLTTARVIGSADVALLTEGIVTTPGQPYARWGEESETVLAQKLPSIIIYVATGGRVVGIAQPWHFHDDGAVGYPHDHLHPPDSDPYLRLLADTAAVPDVDSATRADLIDHYQHEWCGHVDAANAVLILHAPGTHAYCVCDDCGGHIISETPG